MEDSAAEAGAALPARSVRQTSELDRRGGFEFEFFFLARKERTRFFLVLLLVVLLALLLPLPLATSTLERRTR